MGTEAGQMAGGVTREQIKRAKEVQILDYILANEPHNVKRSGGEYRLRDHDSLTISNGMWNWRSRGFGCRTATALNFLIEVRGFSFVDAVRQLAGDRVLSYHIEPQAKPPPSAKPFLLPPRSKKSLRVISYLQSRGIAKPLILDCIERGIIYESPEYHNAVFVGLDESGKARYATMRGTLAEFRRDADGSDKRYGFCLPLKDVQSNTVAVFESPVDALSHQMLYPDFDGYRLSLGGTSLLALTHFLELHSEVTDCVICTDNDRAGDLAATKIAELPGLAAVRLLPQVGKDFNDTLQSVQKAGRMASRTRTKVEQSR
jgi:hypothetical protein